MIPTQHASRVLDDRRTTMSIVRVGLGENKEFADGYEAIFGKKDKDKKPEATPEKTESAEKKTDESEGKKSDQ
jgi:CDGSH-type Zn-finger protein